MGFCDRMADAANRVKSAMARINGEPRFDTQEALLAMERQLLISQYGARLYREVRPQRWLDTCVSMVP